MINAFSSLLPKKQINSDIFLNDHAKCNGCVTRIAVWDTGIDPTAAGLQITPDGNRKIVDMIDASGSGDVKMKYKRFIDQKHRIIETLTGRKVEIPSHWNPPDGIIRIGVKPASELFPKLLMQRLRGENRDNFWRPCIKRIAANLAYDLTEAEEYLNQNLMSNHNGNKSWYQHYSPLEIIYDCFVFHDGNEWVACIDTSPYNPNTKLSDLPLLRDYTVNHQYASFGEQTQLYYTVKIFDNGKLLQIVTNNSSHGTHVAAIASAYFPNHHSETSSPSSGTVTNSTMLCDRDGVAPGAQIVSIKISDSRLGPMETGISLLRAIRWTIELKCDIVNYSFGEQAIWPNIGRISKYLNRMIHKYGIIMVASGGNNGPSLGSLSCPGGTVQGVIGVAPLVFPDMMHYLYCQPSDSSENAKPTAYNWGSRGPAFDGALGICVAAPGGANTSIASWQLKPASVLSGSSMSAPMVTGGISLILSGLRHRYTCSESQRLKIPSSLIYRCLMNTCKSFEHLSYLDQGYGLMQVDRAFCYVDRLIHKLYERNKEITNLCTDFKNVNGVDHVDDISSPSSNVENSSIKLLPVPDPCIMYGWHIRLTVSGPGCTLQNRGIWLRRGWLLSPRAVSNVASLPLLRYTVSMNIEFDEYVPIDIRRNMELHLTTEVASDLDKLTNYNAWLQIASMITVTSTPRDINLVIDPNRFNQLLCEINEEISPSNDEYDATIKKTQYSCNKCLGTNKNHSKGLLNQQEISSISENQLTSQLYAEQQHQQMQHNELSGFGWPSNLISSIKHPFHSLPVKSQKPYVMMLSFKAINEPEMGRLHRDCFSDHPRFLFSDRFDAKNKVRRWFIEVPYGATAGILRLARIDDDGDKSCEFTITVNSPCIGMDSDSQEIRWTFVELNKFGQTKSTLKRNDKYRPSLSSDDFDCASQFGFPIKWETDCLELTIAQHWGLEMPAIVIGELYFRGLEPSLKNIVLNTSDRYCRIGLRSNFINESIQPDIWLTHWCLPVKPHDSKIFYLGHGINELLPNNCGSYALRLTYRFSCPFKTATTIISLPWLQDMLYTSDYSIHIFHIYDNCGRYIGAGEYDGHRQQRPKFTFNLQKGDYKVIAQICHESGPSLKREPIKPLSVPCSPGTELSYMLSEYKNADSTAINSTWSPLQSLQNTPILVSFRLTGGMELASGRKGGSCLTGQSIVQFEFSSFPSSLNLNGTKFCSAMDPLTSDAKQTSMINRSILNNHSSNAIKNDQHTDNIESNRFELVKLLPCLPNRVNAYETISIFLGLTNERSIEHQYKKNENSLNNNNHNHNSDCKDTDTSHTSTHPNHHEEKTYQLDKPYENNNTNHGSSSNMCENLINNVKTDLTDERRGWDADNNPNNDVNDIEQKAEVNDYTKSSSNESDSQSNDHNTLDSLNIIEKHAKISTIPNNIDFNVNHSNSETICGQQTLGATASVVVITPPKSTTEHNLPNDSKNQTSSSFKVNSYNSDEFSTILCKIHVDLCSLDKPFIMTPMKKNLKINAPTTTDGTCVFASSCSNLSLNGECTLSSPLSSRLELCKSDSLCNLLKPEPPDGCVVSQSNRGVAKSENKDNPKPFGINLNEFKLRLIDILTRYGRLIAERLICLNYIHNQLTYSNQYKWSLYNFMESKFQYLDKIYERLIKLTSQTALGTDSIGFNIQLGNHALPGWLLLSTDCKLNKNDENLSSMNYGSIDEPPVGALKGIINCSFPSSSTSSFGVLRQCHATLENSLEIAKSTLPWLTWLLKQIGWSDLAIYLNQQAPILFPQRDYSLLGENN
ncbi:tripeptidyl-peptidase II (S08 family) [Schistosoma mansoni]|uniref:tripeptidyl-peptidase II (S08 family) n=1 Tax=Schistosoma mansoni TaxID=6183 RepID=UPI0001A6342D|nr:tripeptidyl-peptidase II (S08 family) [Schistosoma mansoni]|eukprot:XP_018653361.1 tripeptidyl-peptidase II (S08 family) [Schistosoma mansoni]